MRWMRGLRLAMVAIGLGLSTAAVAAETPLVVTAADLRDAVDLDGEWHWSVDPYRDGLAGFHGDEAGTGHRRFDEGDPTEAMQRDPKALYEYDMQRSPVATLPASWINHAPEMRHYQGLVWYQRHFSAAPKPGQRALLRFGAANYAASVYVNGKLAGKHVGGFTPFTFDVTALIRSGDNQVTVGVDSVHGDEEVPPQVTDWEDYGGITRSVRLLMVPDTYVDEAWVRLARGGRILASGRLDGPGARGTAVSVQVAELGLTLSAVAGADGRWSAAARAPAALRRWSPETPKLYDVTVTAAGDTLRDRIGFRTVEVRGTEILLNGKPIFLRGISMHEEEIGADPTRRITPAAARALLETIKTGLHGNFVRLSHYPHSEVTTRMADELGLIVWSEIPVYWRVAWDNPGTLATARRMLAENILRDRNRASIALWSVGNETPIGTQRTAFLTTLVKDVRALDDTRLVTAALLSGRREENGTSVITMDDPLAGALDVMAVNTYNGWYSPDPLASLPAIQWHLGIAKPLILSEFGADAKLGYRDRAATPHKFSEEYQAEYYRQTLAMADRISGLAGLSPWILKDFRSPRRQHPLYQMGWNRKGLISEMGERKAAFGVLSDYYEARAAR